MDSLSFKIHLTWLLGPKNHPDWWTAPEEITDICGQVLNVAVENAAEQKRQVSKVENLGMFQYDHIGWWLEPYPSHPGIAPVPLVQKPGPLEKH